MKQNSKKQKCSCLFDFSSSLYDLKCSHSDEDSKPHPLCTVMSGRNQFIMMISVSVSSKSHHHDLTSWNIMFIFIRILNRTDFWKRSWNAGFLFGFILKKIFHHSTQCWIDYWIKIPTIFSCIFFLLRLAV